MLLGSRDAYDPHHLHHPTPWHYPIPAVNAYFGLEIAGFCMLVLLIITSWCSPIIHRDKSLYNLFVVLSLACVFHTIVWLPHGKPEYADPPGFALCLTQSMFVMGNSTAQAIAAIGIIFKVWLTAVRLETNRFAMLDNRYITWTMFMAPWLSWLAYAVWVLITGLRDPAVIKPTNLYCYVADHAIITAHHYTSAGGIALVIIFEIHLGWLVFRHYKDIRSQSSSGSVESRPTSDQTPDQMEAADFEEDVRRMNAGNRINKINLPLTFRILWFGVYTLVLAGIAIYIAVDKDSAETALPDLANATIAPACAICFGSQRDVIDSWINVLLWPRRKILARRRQKQKSLKVERTMELQSSIDDKQPIDSPGLMLSKTRPEEMDMFEALAWFDSDGRSETSRC